VGVGLIHVAMVALLLNVTIAPIPATQPSAVEILIVDPEPETAVPATADDPTVVEPIVKTPPSAQSGPEATPSDPEEAVAVPEVLVQTETESVQTDPVETSAGEPSEMITSDQIAAVLQGLSCQSLTRKPQQDCPETDPFTAADAIAIREGSARGPAPLSFQFQQNTTEQFFANQKKARHMFPGMDADMFADPQPSGAYTADRIRNGQEPLWSEELKRGFRKRE